MILTGDCLEILPTLDAELAASIVTDPPYGLSFMGKEWDHGVPGVPFWVEALRVAKMGAFLLAFGGTRTFHRLACAIEDAGWEIRDTIMWVYGSGFPKSHDVSKGLDKVAGQMGSRGDYISKDHAIRRKPGNERMHEGYQRPWRDDPEIEDRNARIYIPATDAARQWEGWGTALKPAWEPILVCRKPLVGTVAENVLKYGTGGLNIDGCRVEVDPAVDDMLRTVERDVRDSETWKYGSGFRNETNYLTGVHAEGRWPANLIHDGSDEVVGLFPESKGQQGDLKGHNKTRKSPSGCFGEMAPASDHPKRADSGSAARFFYCAKASKQDRDEGLDGPETLCGMMEDDNYPIKTGSGNLRETKRRNNHPTVKPNALMRYLCRLVTPPGGTILDPFMGSGSTGKAAIQEGFEFIGIDNDPESVKIAEKRIEAARLPLFG